MEGFKERINKIRVGKPQKIKVAAQKALDEIATMLEESNGEPIKWKGYFDKHMEREILDSGCKVKDLKFWHDYYKISI